MTMNSHRLLLPIDAALACGLVVNELISNALKHVFPGNGEGEIRIDLAPAENGHAMLSVSDNGVGIPETFDVAATATLGLQLVTLLADQLGGELTVQRSQPTRFALRFPLRKENAPNRRLPTLTVTGSEQCNLCKAAAAVESWLAAPVHAKLA